MSTVKEAILTHLHNQLSDEKEESEEFRKARPYSLHYEKLGRLEMLEELIGYVEGLEDDDIEVKPWCEDEPTTEKEVERQMQEQEVWN